MKKTHPLLFGVLLGLIVLVYTSFTYVQTPQVPTEHQLEVRKLGDVWRVVYAADTSKTEVRVKRRDRIVWKAVGSDMHFQFMTNDVVIDQGNNPVFTRPLKDGQSLRLVVHPNAERRKHPYAVFIQKDNTFAVGNSPPNIIIE